MADEETKQQEEEKKEEAKAEEAPAEETAPVEEKPAVEETKPVEEKAEKPEPSGKFKDLIKQIEGLTVLELAELVKELEERFGVSAAAPMMMAGAAPASTAGGAPIEEEKNNYTIMLTDAGAQKIAVIKALREIRPDLGLKEAKDLVDGAPKEIKKDAPKAEAEEAKKKIEAAGGKVELK